MLMKTVAVLLFMADHADVFYLSSLRTCILILERGEGRERNINGRDKYRLVASHMCPDWDRICNLAVCPGGESNLQPFSLQDDAPTD